MEWYANKIMEKVINELFTDKNNYNIFRAASIGFGLSYVALFWQYGFGINYPLYVCAVFFATDWALRKTSVYRREKFIPFAFLGVFLSLKFAYSMNALYLENNFVLVIAAYFMGVFMSCGSEEKYLSDLIGLVFRPFGGIFALPASFFKKNKTSEADKALQGENEINSDDNASDNESATNTQKEDIKEKQQDKLSRSSQILLGIVLASLALCIIVPLMIQADEALKYLLQKPLLPEINLGRLVFKLLIMLIVSGYAFGSICVASDDGFAKRKFVVERSKRNADEPCAALTTLKTFLVIVGVVFFCFALLQTCYLFGKINFGLSAGFSYAQYARNGCFQLWTLTIINLSIVLLSLRESKKDASGEKFFKKVYSLYLISNLLMSVSALYKMLMYYRAYGLTSLRLLVFVMLGVQFVCIGMVWAWVYKKRFHVAKYILITASLAYCALSAVNADAFVAKCNINRYYKTGKIDLYYLVDTLSADALSETADFLEKEYSLEIKPDNSYYQNEEEYIYEETAQGEEYNALMAQRDLCYRLYLLKNENLNTPWQGFNFMRSSLVKKFCE